jgi:ABC-type glycerol-3-phosphate transport system permease component
LLWVIKMAAGTPSQAFSLSASPLPTQFYLGNFTDLLFARDMAGHWLFLHQLFNSVVVSLATHVDRRGAGDDRRVRRFHDFRSRAARRA